MVKKAIRFFIKSLKSMAQIIKMTKPIRFEVFDLIGWTVACYKQQWDCQKLNYPPGGLPDSSSENAKKFFFEEIVGTQTYWYLPEFEILYQNSFRQFDILVCHLPLNSFDSWMWTVKDRFGKPTKLSMKQVFWKCRKCR